MTRHRTAVLLASLVAALACAPAAAQADELFPTGGASPPAVLAARGAQLLWAQRPNVDTYDLQLGFGSQARSLGVTNTGTPAGDLSIDSRGDEVAVYQHCDGIVSTYPRCLRFKVGLAGGAQQQLSSGQCTEWRPLIERGTSVWTQGPAVRRGAHCGLGPYLQYPGRRPQLMHPPRGCQPNDLTGGIVACLRYVDVPQHGSHRDFREYTEIYALRLGTTRWRLIARGDATRVDDGVSGKTLLWPVVSGGYVYWERLIRPGGVWGRVDIMRARATGGPSAQLDRTGRYWTDHAPGTPDADIGQSFAVAYGALYYTVNDTGTGVGIARVDSRDLVFR